MSPRAPADPEDSGPIVPTSRAGGSSKGVRLETATVGITGIAGIAIVLGGYFYTALVAAQRDMISEMRAVRESLSTMDRRVTVLEAPSLDAHIRDLEKRVTVLETQRGR